MTEPFELTAPSGAKQKASGYDRDKDDWYQEPASAVRVLSRTVQIVGDVLDPCCGAGTIPKVLGGRGSDIVDRGFFPGVELRPFWKVPAPCCNIVSNPPYNAARRFVEFFLPITARVVAVIVRLDFLASQERYRLFRTRRPSWVIVLSMRPSMPPGGRGIRPQGGQHDFCWVVWDASDPVEFTRTVWEIPTAEEMRSDGQYRT